MTLDAVIQVDDPQRPANSGPWRLSVRGRIRAADRPRSPGRGPSPCFTAGAFSALLRRGPDRHAAPLRALSRPDGRYDEVLDAAFAARPYMLDHF